MLRRKTPLRSKKGFKKTPQTGGFGPQSLPQRNCPKWDVQNAPFRKGRRTKEWEAIRASLKPKFAAAGITRCELGLPGCWVDNGLGFMHRKKRRYCDAEELHICAIACTACHSIAEAMSHAEMYRMVDAVIRNRAVQPC